MIRPAPVVRLPAPYRLRRPEAPIDLFLDGNEGAAPPADLLAALDVELLRRYPSARSLEACWADRFGVERDRVLVTAGADEALDRTLRAFLGPGREMILPVPTFEMFERYALLTGGTVIDVPWPGGPFPVEAVLARISPATAVIVVVTPNNPTGAVARAEEMVRLSAAAPHAVILIDLAYVEFAAEDPLPVVSERTNVIAARTLSKAWGLAGLRVGCAVGPADLIAALRAAGSPYPVAGPSLALAEAWLRSGDRLIAAAVERVAAERAALSACLRAFGLDVAESQANFVLARFPDAAWVQDALAGLGIAVRAFPGKTALAGALRISCPGDPAAFERLIEGLKAVLRPDAVLCDMEIDAFGSLAGLPLRIAQLDRGAASDSEAVRRVLERLGARRGWLISSRPESLRAAQQVGVVPLGWIPPGADPAAALELRRGGAARIVNDGEELKGWLR